MLLGNFRLGSTIHVHFAPAEFEARVTIGSHIRLLELLLQEQLLAAAPHFLEVLMSVLQ